MDDESSGKRRKPEEVGVENLATTALAARIGPRPITTDNYLLINTSLNKQTNKQTNKKILKISQLIELFQNLWQYVYQVYMCTQSVINSQKLDTEHIYEQLERAECVRSSKIRNQIRKLN